MSKSTSLEPLGVESAADVGANFSFLLSRKLYWGDVLPFDIAPLLRSRKHHETVIHESSADVLAQSPQATPDESLPLDDIEQQLQQQRSQSPTLQETSPEIDSQAIDDLFGPKR